MKRILKKVVVFGLFVSILTSVPFLAFADRFAEDGDRRGWTDIFLQRDSVFVSGYSFCVSSNCSYDTIGVESTLYQGSDYIRDEDERKNTYIAEANLELAYLPVYNYSASSIHWFERGNVTHWLITDDNL